MAYWLINLLSNPSEELHREVFYISKWDNSPDVEIGLGLDGRDSHRYSFHEIINGFRNNQELLEGLQSKNPESYTFVEKQIIEVYKKVVLYDEINLTLTVENSPGPAAATDAGPAAATDAGPAAATDAGPAAATDAGPATATDAPPSPLLECPEPEFREEWENGEI